MHYYPYGDPRMANMSTFVEEVLKHRGLENPLTVGMLCKFMFLYERDGHNLPFFDYVVGCIMSQNKD